jgi:hypothetical protein
MTRSSSLFTDGRSVRAGRAAVDKRRGHMDIEAVFSFTNANVNEANFLQTKSSLAWLPKRANEGCHGVFCRSLRGFS